MSIAPHRLLGFAFACADLLLEIRSDGKISFAVGAAATLAGSAEAALIGRDWREFVDPRDRPVVEALFAGLEGGTRQGPVVAQLAAPRPGGAVQAFAISACRLPQNDGAISCALTRAAVPAIGAGPDGLHDREGFETVTKTLYEAARATGQELEVAFVEMAGLADAASKLPNGPAEKLRHHVAGALRAQSQGGAAAAQLSDDRFALVRATGESPEALAARLARLMAVVTETGPVKLATHTMSLSGEATPSQIVRAIRFALDGFIRDGLKGAPAVTLQEAMARSVRNTLEKANALGVIVAERRFNLVFQPVVRLSDGSLHHHEVLVRFGDDASPFPTIRMAEELDLIEGLDLAIAEQAAQRIRADAKLHLAVNISGRTIISPSFVTAITTLIGRREHLQGRLMFEITESAAIDDLTLADRHIQVLRGLGCTVCLDDFGAGAASLAYLQQLRLDVVKIDGRYIRELQHGGRESAFIRHLVHMCGELKVKTLAEMVETPQVEDAVRRAGVDFAQGWLYGAPAAKPEQPLSRATSRRVGAVESWG